MERTIQDVARSARISSRTLRHYDAIGLLHPIRLAPGGQRIYDDAGVLRLQRILLLRGLGLALPRIAQILDHSDDVAAADALVEHVAALRDERRRLARQIAAVENTIRTLRGGEELVMESMFDGFDHTAHRAEVENRWGADAYARGDAWWCGMPSAEKDEWKRHTADLARDWIAAAESGVGADSPAAQTLAVRHVAWLAGVPGTPSGTDLRGYLTGLGDIYVADPRFGAQYATSAGGTTGAEFVRDALRSYAAREL